MADIKPIGKALFLREEELRRGIELMFFSYRDFTGEADSILAEQNMGRAHHRAIYFIGRNPGITVSELLEMHLLHKLGMESSYWLMQHANPHLALTMVSTGDDYDKLRTRLKQFDQSSETAVYERARRLTRRKSAWPSMDAWSVA